MARIAQNLDPLRKFKTYVELSKAARRVFTGNSESVKFLASAPTIESIPNYGGFPEVILIGRANVGKSSLINYVCQRKDMAITSRTPGRTQALNFYCVRKPQNRLVNILVDAPGYGTRGRPEWGQLFDFYIQNRAELCRVYILISAEHGVTADDKLMLKFLEQQSQPKRFTVQAVLTKADKVPRTILSHVIEAHQRTISEAAPTCLPVILTSTKTHKGSIPWVGQAALRESILQACGWIAR